MDSNKSSISRLSWTAWVIILVIFLAFSQVQALRGPVKPITSLSNQSAEIEACLDLGNQDVEQTAVTIAKDYPGEYNINQVAEVYDALRKGWYYYSDPSYKERYKHANRTLQDGKISNSIGMGDCDDFAILMASLLESLQGSTRIVFAYDQDTRKNHAYAEVYLGKKSDPRVDKLIGWLKDQYSQTDIPGQTVSGDEVWINLDYNSTYPGGYYFGGGYRVAREVIWQSASKNSPMILPIIDTMDSTVGWKTIGNENGSSVSISSVPSPKGKAIRMDFDLKEGGSSGISSKVSGSTLSQIKGVNLSYYGPSNPISVQLIVGYEDGTSFGYSWKLEMGKNWSSLEALFEDFTMLTSNANSKSANQKLISDKVENLEIICQLDKKDLPERGQIIIDQIRGVINIPQGSPWARAEAERETAVANDLALKSEIARKSPEQFIKSIQLAIESLSHRWTSDEALALRNSIGLLPSSIILKNHTDAILGVAFSPDSTKIVTVSLDGTVRIWDTTLGRQLMTMIPRFPTYMATFSPDNTKIATVSDDSAIRIWDAFSGQEMAKLNFNDSVISFDWVFSLEFSPDSSMIAITCSNSTGGHDAYIWDAFSKRELAKLKYNMSVMALSFSPDKKMIATANFDHTARICDSFSGRELATLMHEDTVRDVVFSPDKTKIATYCDDCYVRVWDLQLRKIITKFYLPRSPTDLFSSTFSHNGAMIAIQADKMIQVWEISSGKELAEVKNNDYISQIAFSPDDTKIAACSSDNTARVWDVFSGKELARMVHNATVARVIFSPDGTKIATASQDNTVRIWDACFEKEVATFWHDDKVKSAIFNLNGTKIATVCDDKTAQIWDSSSGKELQRLNLNGSVISLVSSPEGFRIATVSDDSTIRIQDAFFGQELASLTLGPCMYDSTSKAIICAVYNAVFNQNGSKLAISGYSGDIRIWDIFSGKEPMILTKEDGTVASIAFSPDGKRIAGGYYGSVYIWDVVSGKELPKINEKRSSPRGGSRELMITSIAFSPDGNLIATARADNTARVWDAYSGNEKFKLEHGDRINSVIFSPDGIELATASDDGTARVWDVSSGKELGRFEHNGPVKSVAFSPDGSMIITGSDDRTARVWFLSPERLVCEACARLANNFTTMDWWNKYCSKHSTLALLNGTDRIIRPYAREIESRN